MEITSAESVVSLLKTQGVWEKLCWENNPFLTALTPLLPEDPDTRATAEKLACALEGYLGITSQQSGLFAMVCAGLYQLSGMTVSKVSEVIAEACNHTYDVTYMSRIIRAGAMLAQYPQIQDIGSIMRLTILRKVPDELKAEVFNSGAIAGSCIRTATQEALKRAVEGLNPEKDEEVALGKAVHSRLAKLANMLGEIASELEQTGQFVQFRDEFARLSLRIVMQLDHKGPRLVSLKDVIDAARSQAAS